MTDIPSDISSGSAFMHETLLSLLLACTVSIFESFCKLRIKCLIFQYYLYLHTDQKFYTSTLFCTLEFSFSNEKLSLSSFCLSIQLNLIHLSSSISSSSTRKHISLIFTSSIVLVNNLSNTSCYFSPFAPLFYPLKSFLYSKSIVLIFLLSFPRFISESIFP